MVTIVTVTISDMNLILHPKSPFCLNHVKTSAKSIADSEKVHIFAISN